MSDSWTKLAVFLPTGTFLTFSVLAPLTTNSGNCGNTEHVITGAFLFVMAATCALMSFTDSIRGPDGTVYYGIVTPRGLYSPTYKLAFPDGQPAQRAQGQMSPAGASVIDSAIAKALGPTSPTHPSYFLRIQDVAHAVITVITFVTLALLTPPVSTCYFPTLSNTIAIPVPIIVTGIASGVLTFFGPPRKGVGFPSENADALRLLVPPSNVTVRVVNETGGGAAVINGNAPSGSGGNISSEDKANAKANVNPRPLFRGPTPAGGGADLAVV